jgi:ribosome maturation factor RimP
MEQAEALVGPVVEAAGLEIVDVTFRRESGRRILRVVVDRPGGVDLDAISELSERISRRLDLEGFAPGPYTLEVTSPGIERPLRAPVDFERRVGERVKVKTTEPVEGSRVLVGALVSADAEAIVVASEGGERRVPYDRIASARTVADWDAELRGGGR